MIWATLWCDAPRRTVTTRSVVPHCGRTLRVALRERETINRTFPNLLNEWHNPVTQADLACRSRRVDQRNQQRIAFAAQHRAWRVQLDPHAEAAAIDDDRIDCGRFFFVALAEQANLGGIVGFFRCAFAEL